MNKTLLICATAALLVACKKDDPAPPLASTSSVGSAAAAPAMALTYVIEKDGKTSIDLDAPKEHIKADTTASDGTLHFDPMNLGKTSGEVKIDLTTLKTHTFDAATRADDNTAQTTHALNWLEVGTLVDDGTRKANQYTVFTIQSIDGLSASDLTKVAPTKDGADDVRTVTLTAHGDFVVHGHHVAKDAPLEARFHYPSGAAPTSAPTRIDIKSTTPMHVTLAEHDVKPRDGFGKVAAWTTNLVSKVATNADVTIDVHARPQG